MKPKSFKFPFHVLRRPKRCHRCGGEICDILWHGTVADCKEHEAKTGHMTFCSDSPFQSEQRQYDYFCYRCGTRYQKLAFPRNAKQIARDALLKESPEIYCDVEYVGIYRKQMTYRGVLRPGICCEGFDLVFVKANGATRMMTGIEILEVINNISSDKEN